MSSSLSLIVGCEPLAANILRVEIFKRGRLGTLDGRLRVAGFAFQVSLLWILDMLQSEWLSWGNLIDRQFRFLLNKA
jgi:hypothetical protein